MMRTTVPPYTVAPPAATVPFGTFVTNSSAPNGVGTAVMSHGPLIGPPDHGSTTWPPLSRTIRHPAAAVAAVSSVVGRLPTTTHPPGRMLSAVVRPIPPGQEPWR